MIIECQGCHTKFNLNDDRLHGQQAQVRCSICEKVFWVENPHYWPEETFKESPSGLEPGERVSFEDEDLAPRGEGKLKKALLWIFFLVVLLAVLAYGTYAYFTLTRPDFKFNWKDLPNLFLKATAMDQGTRQLVLENIQGYYKEAPNSARLFVIEGKIKNNYPQARARTKLRASLRDSRGAVLNQKEFYPEGETLPPQGEVPFSIIFEKLPPNLAEFTVEIMSSDPAPLKLPAS
jgi:predicted Zn finger-like uncharacterized protein